MPDRPDRPGELDRNSPSAIEASGEQPPRTSSRTASAGRAFLKALGADISGLAARMKRPSAAPRADASRAWKPWRLARALVFGLVLLCIGGALTVACAMLWALHGLPIDGPAVEAPKPTLLLEAADGTNSRPGRAAQVR